MQTQNAAADSLVGKDLKLRFALEDLARALESEAARGPTSMVPTYLDDVGISVQLEHYEGTHLFPSTNVELERSRGFLAEFGKSENAQEIAATLNTVESILGASTRVAVEAQMRRIAELATHLRSLAMKVVDDQSDQGGRSYRTAWGQVHKMLDELDADPEDREEFVRNYNQAWANKPNMDDPKKQKCPSLTLSKLGQIIRDRRRSP